MLLEGDGLLLIWDNSPHLPRQFYPTRLLVTFQNEHPTAVGYFVQIVRWRNPKLFSGDLTNIRRLLDFKVRNNFSHSRKRSRTPLALQGPLFQGTKSFRGAPPKFPD
jgi:hypothetical protein